MFNINFVDNWIRTADLWNWKQPLYQLSHNYFPNIILFYKRYLLKDVNCHKLWLIM